MFQLCFFGGITCINIIIWLDADDSGCLQTVAL